MWLLHEILHRIGVHRVRLPADSWRRTFLDRSAEDRRHVCLQAHGAAIGDGAGRRPLGAQERYTNGVPGVYRAVYQGCATQHETVYRGRTAGGGFSGALLLLGSVQVGQGTRPAVDRS